MCAPHIITTPISVRVCIDLEHQAPRLVRTESRGRTGWPRKEVDEERQSVDPALAGEEKLECWIKTRKSEK